MSTKKPRGRPAGGLKAGERVSVDYQRVAIRLPVATKARLMAMASVTGKPAWLLVCQGVDVVHGQLDPAERRLVDGLAERLAGHYASGADEE